MSAFELSLITLTLFIAASIFWSTVSVGISPMPSSKKARQVMMHLVETAGAGIEPEVGFGPIVDLGSGWGSLVIPLAKRYPGRQIVAYELSLMPWLVTVLISKLLGLNNLAVYRQDFLKADLSAASVIVCYLFPEGMVALDAKLAKMKTTGLYLISNNFALPSLPAEQTIRLDDFYQSPIYCYQIN